jgi:uncharacterized protein (TIGR02453 family)
MSKSSRSTPSIRKARPVLKAAKLPRFSKDTITFLKTASRQKNPAWLDKNREAYQNLVQLPLQNLAQHLKSKLSAVAPQYHFPQKGIGRIKRSSIKAQEYGSLYKGYVSYNASKPSESRFDHNPNLFFLIQHDDEDGDNVLVAGGLYMPSSRQVRSVREAIAQDASAFDELFASKAFASRFPGGFSKEKASSRPPRGFDPQHPRMDWLKLQAFFVWRSYKMKEFQSPSFPDLVVQDLTQIVRLNELLEKAIQGRLPSGIKDTAKPKKVTGSKKSTLESRLEEIEIPQRPMDF